MSREMTTSRVGNAPDGLAKAGAFGLPDRRTLTDKLAGGVVRAGGIGIIASILAILVFIVVEVWPLVVGAKVTPTTMLPLAHGARAVSIDPYKSLVASIETDGVVRVRDLRTHRIEVERPFRVGADSLPFTSIADPDGQFLGVIDGAGGVILIPIEWEIGFEDQQRVVRAAIEDPSEFRLSDGKMFDPFTARMSKGDGSQTIVALTDGDQLVMLRRSREVNEFTEEVVESESRSFAAAPAGLNLLVLDDEQEHLYGAAPGGRLFYWTVGERIAPEPDVTQVDGEITALDILFGGRALVVGLADGGIHVWYRTTDPGGADGLSLVRKFPPHAAAIRHIASSRRDKGFVAVDEAGGLGLYYSTSERVLWRGSADLERVDAVAVTPKADGIVLAGPTALSLLDVDNPHPDVSVWSLFAPVWYEGYDQPEYVWQSSGGTDDFEPKYSLTPLLIGTLKGTVYSLLLAIPLGVLGAMYVSQFMHPRLRNVIKPTVEIMAALPSVVLGFLAGLWLAPRVEEAFSSLILMLVLFPVVIIGTGLLWERLPLRWRNRMPVGSEVLAFVFTLALAGGFCIAFDDVFEAAVFGGSFQTWLRNVTGLQYDQRNAVIVGLAMGFAVIPIIFAISEDAFSNVPRNLVSGSLALGANRWQTVSRVVLPTASPGIFSAVMIGFGRAVGETMIVLMATGNTPILDWNPFNGFRTLSANIAVEIPEAPQFGTLYRVLFLAALLLFVVTFAVNTAAELVRQRLRERYARL